MLKVRKSQSILEYVIILTAVVAGIIYAANRVVGPQVKKSLIDASDTMERQTTVFFNAAGGGQMIDFKTGQPTATDPERIPEYSREQIVN